MPEILPEAVRSVLARVDDLLERVVLPAQARLDQDPSADAAVRSQVVTAARAAELYALAQPADGDPEAPPRASQLLLTAVRERLSASNVPAAEWVLGPHPGALLHARGEARARFLEPVLAGELRAAFAFTEPSEAEPTVAMRDRDQLRITGRKPWVTGGATADLFLVVARYRGTADAAPDGPVLCIVPRDTPGLAVQEERRAVDGSVHAAIALRDAVVPASWTLGEPGAGMPATVRQIADTRLVLAARATGLLLWLRDWLEPRLTAPRRGGALSEREGVRLRYGDQLVRAYAARSMLYRTARLADLRRAEGADPGRAVLNEGMMTKLFAIETAEAFVDAAIQWVGADALVADHPLIGARNRLRTWRLAEGADDTLRLNVARGRFDYGAGTL